MPDQDGIHVTNPDRTDPKTADPIDQVLSALDPDRGRPSDVVCSRELSLSFGTKKVISGIDMSFRRGTITALIGPTGSGKSTFLRTINRMNDKVAGFHHEGDVTFDEQSIWSTHHNLLTLRRRIGMLFQRPNPFPMSIRDNVVAGVKAHRIAKGKQLDVVAEQRLREVGLWDAVKDRLGDSPFRLSGGQQQLLCLARALAVGPEVLLLDEPTSALDPISTEYIEALLGHPGARADAHHRHAQPGTGPPRLEQHDVLLRRPTDRARRHDAAFRTPSEPKHRALRHRSDRLTPSCRFFVTAVQQLMSNKPPGGRPLHAHVRFQASGTSVPDSCIPRPCAHRGRERNRWSKETSGGEALRGNGQRDGQHLALPTLQPLVLGLQHRVSVDDHPDRRDGIGHGHH